MAVFTHCPLHARVPTGHSHAPLTHACPTAHTVPQPPQFETLVSTFTQSFSQAISLASAQVVPHTPPEQTWPRAHALPHVPQ
jgi:hypothetical protein